jgi:ribosomal protein S18 acetylase RimI-like enzyme
MNDDRVAQIRLAAPDDARSLAAMHIASWRETYTGILPDKMLSSLSEEKRAAAWLNIMREPPTKLSTAIYLAEHEATIIGFASCGGQRTENLRTKGYESEIGAIYVLREFQKRKIGTRLLSTMCLDLIGRGFTATSLWVLRDNLRARRFYERYAGRVIAEREEVRDDAVLVELAYGWPDLEDLARRF